MDDESHAEESEGNINKGVLFSIGSMAKLKHPRRYWPKVTNAQSTSVLDGFQKARNLEFSRSATLSSLVQKGNTTMGKSMVEPPLSYFMNQSGKNTIMQMGSIGMNSDENSINNTCFNSNSSPTRVKPGK